MQLSNLPQSELSTSYVDGNRDWEDYLYMRPLGSSEKNERSYFISNAPGDQTYGLMCNVFHGQNRIGYGFHITATESFNEKKIGPRVLKMLKQSISNCPDLEIRFFDACDF